MEWANKHKITTDKGFVYEITIVHKPHIGSSYAYYNGSIIADNGYGRHLLPQSDNDREWEEFEERFFEGLGGEVTETLLYHSKQHLEQLNK